MAAGGRRRGLDALLHAAWSSGRWRRRPCFSHVAMPAAQSVFQALGKGGMLLRNFAERPTSSGLGGRERSRLGAAEQCPLPGRGARAGKCQSAPVFR